MYVYAKKADIWFLLPKQSHHKIISNTNPVCIYITKLPPTSFFSFEYMQQDQAALSKCHALILHVTKPLQQQYISFFNKILF